MYDPQAIKAAFIGLVGYRQNEDPQGVQLIELTTSSSGLWFNSQHPLLTIANLEAVAPNYGGQGLTDPEVNVEFTAWLREKTEDAIIEAVNDWLAVSGLRSSFGCDYTDEIVDQAGTFAPVVALRVALLLLRQIAFNPHARNNRNEANPNTDRPVVLFETDGDTQGRNDFSLGGRYNRALKTLSFDISQIPDKCLKCRKTKIRNRTVGPRTYPPSSS